MPMLGSAIFKERFGHINFRLNSTVMLGTRKKTFAVFKEGPTKSRRTLKNEGQK